MLGAMLIGASAIGIGMTIVLFAAAMLAAQR